MGWKRFGLVLGALLAASAPATAQTSNTAKDPEWKGCHGGEYLYTAGAISIDACNRILATRSLTARERAVTLQRRGEREYHDQRLPAAIASFTEALGVSGLADADRIYVLRHRAQAHSANSDDTAARRDYDAAVKISPGQTNIWRGTHALERDRAADARSDADAALATLAPKDFYRWEAYELRGRARFLLKEEAGALADFGAAIKVYDSASPHLYRGSAFEALGRFEEALADYILATERAGSPADAWNAACWTLAASLRRDFERARTYCEGAISRDTDNATYVDSLGLVWLQLGRWRDAWNAYDRIVRGVAEPWAGAYHGRGLAALRLGKTTEGRADLAKAAAIDPQIAQAYAGYGQKP